MDISKIIKKKEEREKETNKAEISKFHFLAVSTNCKNNQNQSIKAIIELAFNKNISVFPARLIEEENDKSEDKSVVINNATIGISKIVRFIINSFDKTTFVSQTKKRTKTKRYNNNCFGNVRTSEVNGR